MLHLVLCFLTLSPITFQCIVKGDSETFFIVMSDNTCFESGNNESSLGSGHAENIDGSFGDEELPCLTLQQFVERFSNDSYQNLASITLELDSGEHSLNSTLTFFNITSFVLKSGTATAATIICSQPGVRLQLHSIEDVVISETTFVGCEEIEIVLVDQFRFENSSFRSSPNGSLVLNHTSNATIIESNFLELTQSHCLKAAMTINNSSILIQFCNFSSSETSIYSTNTTITIDSCTFVNNTLNGCDDAIPLYTLAMVSIVNGPLKSETVTITNSDFIDSQNSYYHSFTTTMSIVFISESDHDGSVLVLNNSFVSNIGFLQLLQTASSSSQIIMDHNDFCDNEITSTAAIDVYAVNISITITHSNFIDNTATAVHLHINDGIVIISESTFSGNGHDPLNQNGAVAIECGDYCEFYDYLPLNISVRIIQCTFISNCFSGIVLGIIFDTGIHTGSILIIQSTFIDNFAADGGAVVTIDTNSSVLIESCSFIKNKGTEGGALHIKDASLVLVNHTNFLNNQGIMYRGAALTLDVDNAIIVINETHFFGNINTRIMKPLNRRADKRDIPYIYDGLSGTLDLVGTYNSLIIDRSSFINNSVNVIHTRTLNGSIIILRSNFTNNTNQF